MDTGRPSSSVCNLTSNSLDSTAPSTGFSARLLSPLVELAAVVKYSTTRLMHAPLKTPQSCPPREKDTRKAAVSAAAAALFSRPRSSCVFGSSPTGRDDPCGGAPPPKLPSLVAAASASACDEGRDWITFWRRRNRSFPTINSSWARRAGCGCPTCRRRA